MKLHATRVALALTLAIPLAFAGNPSFAADTHHHGETSASATQLNLDQGRKWASDAPLRQAMNKLSQAVGQALPAAHSGSLTDAQYDALGNQANLEFAYIVENCKLSPQADAVLHVILADMVGGVETLTGKQTGQARASGVVQLAEALNRYAEYFDHPDWQAIQIPS